MAGEDKENSHVPNTNDPPVTLSPNFLEQKKMLEDKLSKYLSKIEIDEWDTEAWTNLIAEVREYPIDLAREYYEKFFEQFPTAGKFWKIYAEHEKSAKNYQNVDKLFTRCLLQCPNIELWKFYIGYIKETKANLPNSKEEIIKAFDFTLDHMGMDISSTQIWVDYIEFLKSQKPPNQREEDKKISSLRKLYHRAIENPMHNLETIWKDYDTFENDLNKILAKAMLNEHSSKYMAAKSVYRERKRYYEGILRNMLARPPSGSVKDEHQVCVAIYSFLIFIIFIFLGIFVEKTFGI